MVLGKVPDDPYSLMTHWYVTTVRAECIAWCQGRYLTTPKSLMTHGYFMIHWYMTTVRVECVAWCQGRYLTTSWYVTTIRAECVALCQRRYLMTPRSLTTHGHLTISWYVTTIRAECGTWYQTTLPLWPTILLVIKDSFSKLMMFLVTKNSFGKAHGAFGDWSL